MSLDYKNRSEVPEKYKIDFSFLYKTDEDWYKELEYVKKHVNDLEKYKGHLLDNEHILMEWLELNTKISKLIEKLYVYAHVNSDCDLNNSNYTKMVQEIIEVDTIFSTNNAFITPELLKHDYDEVKDLISKNRALEKYQFTLENIYRFKDYTLSDAEEKIISSLASIMPSFENIATSMSNAEIKYGSVIVDGKEKEIISSNSLEFATHPDQSVRKQAALQKMEKLGEFNNTFATSLTSTLKMCDTMAKLRGFASFQAQELYDDNVTLKMYNNIIDSVHKQLGINKRWYEVVRNCLGLKTLYAYDTYAPFLKEYKKKYSIEEAQDIIVDALKVLGDEYSRTVRKLYDERCVDYCSYRGKQEGAYEVNTYNTRPLIVTNYSGFTTDVTDLAHETGHAINSYFADANNDDVNAQFRIFTAEVASLTNEILVSNYIINNSVDNKEKLMVLHNVIDTIEGYFFNACMQAEFEQIVNTKISEGQVLTKDDINNDWLSLLNKYYDPSVKYDDIYKVGWARIPHFYAPFYTYKYVIGIVGACYVASNIINGTPGFIDKYLEFLKTGDTDYPTNILKKIGVDLDSEEPFNVTMELLNKLVEEFKELYKEVDDEG